MPDRIVSIGVIYLPPDRRADTTAIENHIASVGSILSNLNQNDLSLLLGDYNQPGIVWSHRNNCTVSIDFLQSNISTACSALIDGFDVNNLSQINYIVNANGRLLDLALVNDKNSFELSAASEPMVSLDSNHPALDLSINIKPPVLFEDTLDSSILNFRKADFDSLSAAISEISWDILEMSPAIDDAISYFNLAINSAIARFVPARRPVRKPAWSNNRLRQLKRQRSSALRKYRRLRNIILKEQFTRVSKNYRKYNRFLYRQYTFRMQSNLRRNPRLFWSFVNKKRKEDGLPVNMFLENQQGSTLIEKCSLFAQNFQRNFHETTASNTQINSALNGVPSDVVDLNLSEITSNLVEAAIAKLNISYAAGPDGIPSCILKKCSSALIHPLCLLFNLSLRQCVFPSCWKLSVMFPVYKKGDKRDVKNYRGITSLCACSKVMEIILNDALFSACKHYISADQHGFHPKRSTTTNLVPFTSTCLTSMSSGGQVDAVYTDLKAAFDRVDHKILLAKLGKLGVSSALVRWFQSYLMKRTLCVKIGTQLSPQFCNLSGVPQGSNLGPLLFTLFVNDLSLLIPEGCRLFYADDVKLYKIIRDETDCNELQRLINLFHDWCIRNMLTVSIQKCCVISFQRKKQPITHSYVMADQPLMRVTQVRDLGVTLDAGLTFRLHYSEIISRANRQLGFIFKIADEFRDPLCLRSLYCSLVRSILETSSVVWCPFHNNWIVRIESIQRKFVRFALRFLTWRNSDQLPAYADRCRLLGLQTLEQRRFDAQVIFVGKLLLGEIDAPEILQRLGFYAPERSLRPRHFLHLQRRHAVYSQHDPIRFMSASFNTVADLFDFDISGATFKQRVLRR